MVAGFLAKMAGHKCYSEINILPGKPPILTGHQARGLPAHHSSQMEYTTPPMLPGAGLH